jgi:hypothetical protein
LNSTSFEWNESFNRVYRCDCRQFTYLVGYIALAMYCEFYIGMFLIPINIRRTTIKWPSFVASLSYRGVFWSYCAGINLLLFLFYLLFIEGFKAQNTFNIQTVIIHINYIPRVVPDEQDLIYWINNWVTTFMNLRSKCIYVRRVELTCYNTTSCDNAS